VSRAKPAKRAAAEVDGRHARAGRTREAIVEALLGLLAEGELQPSADRIAERAGISRRALFHHFVDREDLLTQAGAQRFRQIMEILPIVPTEGSFDERARAFVTGMGHFHDQIAPMRRAALLFAHQSKFVETRMLEAIHLHRETARAVFTHEITRAPEGEREWLVRSLAAVTGFAAWDELRRNQGLSLEEAARTTLRFVEALFPAASRGAKGTKSV